MKTAWRNSRAGVLSRARHGDGATGGERRRDIVGEHPVHGCIGQPWLVHRSVLPSTVTRVQYDHRRAPCATREGAVAVTVCPVTAYRPTASWARAPRGARCDRQLGRTGQPRAAREPHGDAARPADRVGGRREDDAVGVPVGAGPAVAPGDSTRPAASRRRDQARGADADDRSTSVPDALRVAKGGPSSVRLRRVRGSRTAIGLQGRAACRGPPRRRRGVPGHAPRATGEATSDDRRGRISRVSPSR